MQSKNGKEAKMEKTDYGVMNEDLLQKVLSKVPASSFASAACVNKHWNQISRRVLSRPKLASALSLNPSLPEAVKEVLDDVLSKPIKPHFAIAHICSGFGLHATLEHITQRLGTKVPIIVTESDGIIGKNVGAGECREVKWDDDSEFNEELETSNGVTNVGIVLTVGFVPSLKINAIPLFQLEKVSQGAAIDKFVKDIRDFSASVSGSTSPVGIMMFGDQASDMKPVIEVLDYAMSEETVIVGDERVRFLYRSVDQPINSDTTKYKSDAVALVFARDLSAANDVGKINLHVAVSNGMRAIGPTFKAVSVRENSSDCVTWLTARREGELEVLDGQIIMDEINNQLENLIGYPDLYIGVTKRRKFSKRKERAKMITSLVFHGVIGGDEEYLYADGVGLRTGDFFQFYLADPSTAASSCESVSVNLRNLKLNSEAGDGSSNFIDEKDVLGGYIFSCCGRGKAFFAGSTLDSIPFLENFPHKPIAGLFCSGEIGRVPNFTKQEEMDKSFVQSCLHVYSTVYLVMIHTPALPSQ